MPRFRGLAQIEWLWFRGGRQPVEPLVGEDEELLAVPLGDDAADDLGVDIEVVVDQGVAQKMSEMPPKSSAYWRLPGWIKRQKHQSPCERGLVFLRAVAYSKLNSRSCCPISFEVFPRYHAQDGLEAVPFRAVTSCQFIDRMVIHLSIHLPIHSPIHGAIQYHVYPFRHDTPAAQPGTDDNSTTS